MRHGKIDRNQTSRQRASAGRPFGCEPPCDLPMEIGSANNAGVSTQGVAPSMVSIMTDTPNFQTWDKDELANWANHAYLTIQTNQAEMEQLRLKIASIVEELQGVRNLIASVIDPL